MQATRKFWYWAGMRRNAKSITTSPEIVRNIHGLTEANFQLLTKLIGWLDGHEQQHTNYRLAMIQRLTRVEAAISLILVSQQAQDQSKPPQYSAEKLEEDARGAEAFIAKQSQEEGMKMIQYIYGKALARPQAPEPRHDRRRRWWGWEI